MKKIITTMVVGLICVSMGLINGCGTVQGFGKDVSKGGQEIQKAARSM